MIHLVNDVKRFGPLHKFNAYPFESKLYENKNLIRTVSKPLVQIAKRLSELKQVSKNATFNDKNKYPELKKEILEVKSNNKNLDAKNIRSFSKIEWANFSLSSDSSNKWFLTSDNQVVSLKYITEQNGSIKIIGTKINDLQLFFETPIKSNVLHIYQSNGKCGPAESYDLSNVKCKMVTIPIDDSGCVFLPLLHTL